MDAGTLLKAQDNLDDQINKDAQGVMDAVGTGSWVAAVLGGVSLATLLIRKYGLGLKKVPKPEPVKAQNNPDNVISLLKMKEKKDE